LKELRKIVCLRFSLFRGERVYRLFGIFAASITEPSLMTFNMKMALLICAFTLGFVGAVRSGLIFGNDGNVPPGVHVYGPETTDSK
jgi:hypothetical protein